MASPPARGRRRLPDSLGFVGNSTLAMDDKGRVNVPARFREQLESLEGFPDFVAALAPEGCLFLFPAKEWRKLLRARRRSSVGKATARRFDRSLVGNAEALQLDRQGRIQLPRRLREYASLEKELVLAGSTRWIEVWSKAAWEATQVVPGSADYSEQWEVYLDGLVDGDDEFEDEGAAEQVETRGDEEH